MQLRRFETPKLAHYAYLLADGGEAAVVDPRRDVDEYIAASRALGVRIRWVIETHRQEDFVMGAAELAERTGASIVNGAHELFGHGDVRLEDGDTIELGRMKIRALHTPGHTPESVSFAVFSRDDAQRAWGVFTGDALLFGDTGRTDLADPERSHDNAALLHEAIHSKIAPLGDGALVFPAHGPGSICGSGLAVRPMSTVGSERGYNIVFTLDEDAFARKKAAERLPRPPYFRHMEEVNRGGGLPPAGRPDDVPWLGPDELARGAAYAKIIDTRSPEAFAGGHIEGSYAIWRDGLPAFAGWVAASDTNVLLVLERDEDLEIAYRHLSRIGIDAVRGALCGGFEAWRGSGHAIETSGVLTPHRLFTRTTPITVLDAREVEEYESGHVEGARHCFVGDLEPALEAGRIAALGLDRDRPLVVTCSIGNRSGLAVSILQRHGFRDVSNLLGGMTAWRELHYPFRSEEAA